MQGIITRRAQQMVAAATRKPPAPGSMPAPFAGYGPGTVQQQPVYPVAYGTVMAVSPPASAGQQPAVPAASSAANLVAQLWTVIEAGQIDVVRDIIENKGVSVHVVNENGSTPLLQAAWKGQLEVCRYLLTKGANVHSVNKNGVIAVQLACHTGHLAILELLDRQGSNLDHKTTAGWTALQYGAVDGHLNVCQYLVGRGVNINTENTVSLCQHANICNQRVNVFLNRTRERLCIGPV
jgi:ankyrin repeat protein